MSKYLNVLLQNLKKGNKFLLIFYLKYIFFIAPYVHAYGAARSYQMNTFHRFHTILQYLFQ